MSMYVLSYSKEFHFYPFTTADVFGISAGIGVVLHCLHNTCPFFTDLFPIEFFVVIELRLFI